MREYVRLLQGLNSLFAKNQVHVPPLSLLFPALAAPVLPFLRLAPYPYSTRFFRMISGTDFHLLESPAPLSASHPGLATMSRSNVRTRIPRRMRRRTVSAIDLGTTKICALVGRMDEFGGIQLLGMGQVPSNGFKRGMVADIDQAVGSISAALEMAEEQSGTRITEVYAGIAGGHISCVNSSAMVEVRNPMRGVTASEKARVLERCKQVAIPEDREIVHVIPQEFICDDQGGVKNPIGMSCTRLEAKVHLVTAAVASAQNIVRCLHRSGVRTVDILFESLASSLAILREDEKELGVLLLDIGGGTTDVALFQGGAVRFTGVVPFGGNSITSDIAHAFRISRLDAEMLKHTSGCCLPGGVGDGETIEVHALLSGTAMVESRRFLAEVIEARCLEILEGAMELLTRAGHASAFTAGVVLTGGSSQIEGLDALAADVFGCEVRLGTPQRLGDHMEALANPAYATAQGLLLYGLGHETRAASRPVFLGRFYQDFMRMIDWYS